MPDPFVRQIRVELSDPCDPRNPRRCPIRLIREIRVERLIREIRGCSERLTIGN
jgi:hypothetical protein